VEGVLAHEISHVANGDMVTLTLLQGIVNAFVMFLARVIAFAIAQALRSRDEEGAGPGPMVPWILTMVLDVVLMIFGSMVVAWFRGGRGLRADPGAARPAGRDSMVRALEKLRRTYEIVDPETDKPALEAMKISSRRGGWLALFSSHPPLEKRIARLQTARA